MLRCECVDAKTLALDAFCFSEWPCFQVELAVYDYANALTEVFFAKNVSFRGLIEFSNVCLKSCGYCGIRRYREVDRYSMPKKEIVDLAEWAFMHGYGSVMLQSGELPTPERLAFIIDTIKEIKRITKEKEVQRGVPEEKYVSHSLSFSLILSLLSLARSLFFLPLSLIPLRSLIFTHSSAGPKVSALPSAWASSRGMRTETSSPPGHTATSCASKLPTPSSTNAFTPLTIYGNTESSASAISARLGTRSERGI
jgi:hypothetical protein